MSPEKENQQRDPNDQESGSGDVGPGQGTSPSEPVEKTIFPLAPSSFGVPERWKELIAKMQVPPPPFPFGRSPRLSVNLDPQDPGVTLDHTTHHVEPDEALFVSLLLEAEGNWVTGDGMMKRSGLLGPRPDKILKRLERRVKPLSGLIERRCGKGGGYRLKWEQIGWIEEGE